jgi:hypothetical protein
MSAGNRDALDATGRPFAPAEIGIIECRGGPSGNLGRFEKNHPPGELSTWFVTALRFPQRDPHALESILRQRGHVEMGGVPARETERVEHATPEIRQALTQICAPTRAVAAEHIAGVD